MGEPAANLPIDTVRLYHCRLGMHAEYATHALTQADVLIVELHSGEDIGWGEVFMARCEPLWRWAGEVAPLLLGQDADRLDALLDLWPATRPKLTKEEGGTYCHADVDCVAEAVSIALYDLAARARGLRFAELLGSVSRTRIAGMPVVTLAEPEVMATVAAGWAERGIDYLKLKLSGDAERDAAILTGVGDRLGGAIDLQVDANGAYASLEDAEPIFDLLDATGVAVVEDLFDVGATDLCRAARARLEARYMVDKDAHWPHVQTVLASAAADIINQHPHNQGRMSYAKRIAEAAHAAGVENAIGSSGLLGIQNTAFLHLAATTGLTRPCEDVGLHNYYNGPAGGISFDVLPTVLADPLPLVDGRLTLPDGPGLGVEVDRQRLEALTVATRSFPA